MHEVAYIHYLFEDIILYLSDNLNIAIWKPIYANFQVVFIFA
jgi:hypothetical protein